MDEELRELMSKIKDKLWDKIQTDPISYITYNSLYDLIDEYWNTVFVKQTSNKLRMNHLLEDIRTINNSLYRGNSFNQEIKLLTSKLITFHKILFDYNNTLRLEAVHYKKEVWTYLKSNYEIKRFLNHSLYQARHGRRLDYSVADLVDTTWKDIWDQLSEKVNLIDRIIGIYERGKFIDLKTVIPPAEDSFIVLKIAASSLMDRIDILNNVGNLTKLDKSELTNAKNKLQKFKEYIDKAHSNHTKIMNRIDDIMRIKSLYKF